MPSFKDTPMWVNRNELLTTAQQLVTVTEQNPGELPQVMGMYYNASGFTGMPSGYTCNYITVEQGGARQVAMCVDSNGAVSHWGRDKATKEFEAWRRLEVYEHNMTVTYSLAGTLINSTAVISFKWFNNNPSQFTSFANFINEVNTSVGNALFTFAASGYVTDVTEITAIYPIVQVVKLINNDLSFTYIVPVYSATGTSAQTGRVVNTRTSITMTIDSSHITAFSDIVRRLL